MNPIYYVIISIFALITSIGGVIAAYLLILAQKQALSTEIMELRLKAETFGKDNDSMSVDIKRLNFEHYEKLQKQVTIQGGEIAACSQEVKSLDSAIKTFYAKWAKKLGSLDKVEPNIATNKDYEDGTVIPLEQELTASHNNHVPQQLPKRQRFFG